MEKISKLEYSQIHKWIRDNYGKASKCEQCTNSAKRFDWALKKGCCYERKRNSFIELCRSCHIKYDFTKERKKKLSNLQLGENNNFFNKHFTEDMKILQRKSKNCFKIKCTNLLTNEVREFDSINMACNILLLQKPNVLRCLKGITKQHKKWTFQKL